MRAFDDDSGRAVVDWNRRGCLLPLCAERSYALARLQVL